MGEGPYSEICYGVLDLGPLEPHHEKLTDILDELGAHTSSAYESSAKVLGITVLSTLLGRSNGHRDLSLGTCRLVDISIAAQRTASLARDRYYDRREAVWKPSSNETYLGQARRQWHELQHLAKERYDLDVPDGELIWHEDYA